MALKKFNAVSGFSVGDTVIRDVIDNAANVSANNLTVSATANLGAVGNIVITGGTAGQVLKTNGAGVLSWGQDSASASGSNTDVQFNNAGSLGSSTNFTFDSVTNTLNVDGYIARDNKNVPTYVTSASAPTNPKPGDIWYNSTNDTIYQYIYDGSSFLWIDSSSGYISASVLATPDMIALRDGNGNVYSNNLNSSNVNVTGNLNVTGKSNLGNVGNLHIAGGSTGQVLTTDGSGNLLWAAISTDTASFSNGTSFLTINHNSNIDMTINGVVNVLSVIDTGIVVTGDSNLGDVATANFFDGNGSLLTHITGANVTGYVSNANVANTAYSVTGSNVTGQVAFASTANSVAGANVTGTVASATVAASANSVAGANVTGYVSNANHANIADVANSVAGANVTGYVSNANHANIADVANSVDGSNVTGTVSSATVAASANSVAGANVTGTVSSATVAASANSVAGANVTGTVSSATVAASANSVAGANVTGTVASATVAASANTVAGANVTGTVASATVAASANTVAGANVTGIVANATFATNSTNANVALTVANAAQPNITSVGALTSLTVNGTTTITGNLVVSGSTITANVTSINVKDPLIELGGYANGSPLITDDGKDRGSLLHYFTTSPVDAFMGWDNSNLEFALGSNVTVNNEVVTFNSYGNLRAHTVYANLYGTSTTTISVASSSQPNITSLGNLTSLTVIGNIIAGNVTGGNLVLANYFSGNGYLLSSITGANVTGYVANANHSNIADVANTVAGANVTGYVANALHADEATIASTANSVAGANVTGYVSNANHSNIADVANSVAGANVTGYVSNANHANIADVANSVAGSNVTGYVSNANHANIADVANSVAGANVTGYVADAYYADYAGGAASVAGANVTGYVANATHANIADVANSVAGANVTGYVANANIANIAYSVNGSNVSGQVSNAIVSGTVYTNAQPNITSVGTLVHLTVTGDTEVGTLRTDSILYANGDPYAFSGVPGGSTSQLQFNDGGLFAGSGNLTFNTSNKTLTTDYISANGYLLTSLTGANITGQVSNALVAATVYSSAQSNITSVGTLTGLNVSGAVNLGSITNLHISGGLPGYAITTDGAGNLSWTAATGGGGGGAGGQFISAVLDQFTGDGSQTSFTLSTTPTNSQAVVVNIDGLIQLSSSYTLSGAVLAFDSAPLNGEHIEVTTYGVVAVAGSSGEVQFNDDGIFGSSNAFTFNTTTNSLSVTGNLVASGGYLTLGTGIVAVSSGSAGIFTSGISNINLGLVANVTMGSSSGNVTARGNFIANSITSNTTVTTTVLGTNEIKSTRTPISVTGTTVIDSFAANKYRTAKYTIRVGSDDGYQSIEVLLIHNGASSYITVYGSISTAGSDIVLITSAIAGGNVELYATTTSTNTTVNLIGTYVAD